MTEKKFAFKSKGFVSVKSKNRQFPGAFNECYLQDATTCYCMVFRNAIIVMKMLPLWFEDYNLVTSMQGA